MKDCYWYNRHKGKFATHFGYWSFESGLVSVLCGLDDSAFRDMLYYPEDLVDYARQSFNAGALLGDLRAGTAATMPRRTVYSDGRAEGMRQRD